jgi:predicted transcriptional regulator of viral defense system
VKFDGLVAIVGKEPVFRAGLLQAGAVSTPELRVQLSRWVSAGKLIQLRRGVYALAPPFRQADPHPFVVAQTLRPNSYISLQSSLAFHGLIPEHVATVTAATTGRTEELRTDLGSYVFRHVAPQYFFGYRQAELSSNQRAFVATPEKALIDLVHLTPGGDREAYLRELRLEASASLDVNLLHDVAQRLQRPKILRAVQVLSAMAQEQASHPL